VRLEIETMAPRLRFEIGNVTVNSKVIDGTFPDYARVVPLGNDKRMAVAVDALATGISQVTVLSSERGRAVKLSMEGSRLRLSVENPDTGYAEMDVACEYASEPLDIGFNSRYVTDILSHIDSTSVAFMLADPSSPTLIRGTGNTDDGVFFVLMPMRV
jgi:DNA polymerase-3 subunit beta